MSARYICGKEKEKPSIVVLGGGTGLSVLLRGLKNHTDDITAIVTVADDGGGSGRLRDELGMLPPGDIRSCIIALANTEPTMEKLLQHRFKEGALKGQSFGNLFIAAMNEIYGDFALAINETSSVLSITGKVYPVTLESVNLIANLEDGFVVEGESKIPKIALERNSKIDTIRMVPELSYPLPEAIEAIERADLIILGPGSLYTSVIPNLLVKNVFEAIITSRAKCLYICNVMTQAGESDNYTLSDHVKAIEKHSSSGIIDIVLANNGEIPDSIETRYILDGQKQVLILESDRAFLKSKGIQLIEQELIQITDGLIRHNTNRLSEIILEMMKASTGK